MKWLLRVDFLRKTADNRSMTQQSPRYAACMTTGYRSHNGRRPSFIRPSLGITLLAAALLGMALLTSPVCADTLQGLDVTLNGKNTAVWDIRALSAFCAVMEDAVMEDEENHQHTRVYGMPLRALFPWLSSVEYLEVQSGSSRVVWENPFLSEHWNDALLVFSDFSGDSDSGDSRDFGDLLEIRLGGNVFRHPDRIALWGTPLARHSLRIWSESIEPELEEDMLRALRLRGIPVEWTHITDAGLLAAASPEELPHLLFFPPEIMERISPLIEYWQPAAPRFARWYVSGGTADAGLRAVDARNAETVLAALHSRPITVEALEDWFEYVRTAVKEKKLINSSAPLSLLEAGLAGEALCLPYSAEKVPPGAWGRPLPADERAWCRPLIAAVPKGLSEEAARETERLLRELPDYKNTSVLRDARQLMQPETQRFIDAYNRIGRLALSGQMPINEAAKRIVDYMKNRKPR